MSIDDKLIEVLEKAIDSRIEKVNGEEIIYPTYSLKQYLISAIKKIYDEMLDKEKIEKLLKERISCSYHHEHEIKQTAQALIDYMKGGV